jgi:hypothetical protein
VKRAILAALLVTVTLSACGDDNKPKSHFITRKRTLYNFEDGRTGYYANGIWWYLIPANVTTNKTVAPAISYGTKLTPTVIAAWKRGPAPHPAEIAKAGTTGALVVTTKDGTPPDVRQAKQAIIEKATEERAAPTAEAPVTIEPVPIQPPETPPLVNVMVSDPMAPADVTTNTPAPSPEAAPAPKAEPTGPAANKTSMIEGVGASGASQ